MQNRKPPAFQEYAASMLANRAFRLLDFQERGLLFTMRLEFWENGSLPSNTEELARLLGCSEGLLDVCLSALSSFFRVEGGEIIFDELENYRIHLAERRKKQSEGGRRGASKTNRRHNEGDAIRAAHSPGYPQGTRRDADGVLVQNSPAEARVGHQSQTQPIKKQAHPFVG